MLIDNIGLLLSHTSNIVPVPCFFFFLHLRVDYIFHCGKTLLLHKQKCHISFNTQLIHQNKAGSERGKITNFLHLLNLKHYS